MYEESPNDRNDRAIRVAAVWFADKLAALGSDLDPTRSSQWVRADAPVVLLSDDRGNLEAASRMAGGGPRSLTSRALARLFARGDAGGADLEDKVAAFGDDDDDADETVDNDVDEIVDDDDDIDGEGENDVDDDDVKACVPGERARASAGTPSTPKRAARSAGGDSAAGPRTGPRTGPRLAAAKRARKEAAGGGDAREPLFAPHLPAEELTSGVAVGRFFQVSDVDGSDE
jgi:hypothetical protein